MRQAGPGRHADRTRALIAILWRAGLRISEALALTESDLDPKTGSVLVRVGKGGKRRTVGMDDWAWEHVARWTEHRIQFPIGSLFCILAGPTRGHGWSATAARGRRFAPVGYADLRSAPPRVTTRSTGTPQLRPITRSLSGLPYHPQYPTCPSWYYVDLSPGDRHSRDRGHGPPPASTGDPGECRPATVIELDGGPVVGAPRARRSRKSSPDHAERSPRRSRSHDPSCPIPAANAAAHAPATGAPLLVQR